MAVKTQSVEIKRALLVRLNPGDDILRSLQQAVKENGIKSGVIMSGVGSSTSYHVHVVKTTELPPGDTFFKKEGPFDIIAMNGLVIDGRVHAHVTLANTDKALGGHLEEGCRVLTFCMVVIADVAGAELKGWDSIEK